MSTAEEVAKLQEELEKMKPLLAEAVQESIDTMQMISEDTVCSVDSACASLECTVYQFYEFRTTSTHRI